MRKFDDEEYFLLKELANQVINGVSPALEKISKQCEKLIFEIEEVDKKLTAAESGAEINEYSKISEEKRNFLIRLLAIRNRIQMIIERNKERVSYIAAILKNAGVYNESFDRKKIAEIEKEEKDNVSESTLNLNFAESTGSEHQNTFFEGEILTLSNGELDFSIDANKEVLKTADDDFMSKIMRKYPASLATVSVDMLANTVVKKRVLKAIANYVVDESKKKDIRQINKELGELLEFKTEITKSPEDYIAGVTNMFNVQIKQFLIEQQPDLADEISDKLRCNEKSELIPESKRIAVLAAGIAGMIAESQEEETEEVRIAREKETQQATAANMAFTNMLQQEEQEREIAAEAAELEQLEEMAKLAKEQEEENIKRQKKIEEEEEKKKEQEAEEAQMYRMMSKNRYDD